MSLALKYRPQELDDVIGNKGTVDSLRSLTERDMEEIPHSFLFSGPSGCGKTTLARILAAELNCGDKDLREVDIGDYRGIDTVREIRRQARLRPMDGDVRVWIMDEAHMLTREAQNALLKILEDAPRHAYFMLCTTEPVKLLPTIRSRCMPFQVAEQSDITLKRLIKRVCEAEGKKIPKGALNRLATDALGSPRAALVMLDKVIDLDPEKMEKMIESAASEENQVIDLCRALIAGKDWKEIGTILQGLKEQDPEGARRMVLGYFASILVKSNNSRAYMVMEAFEEPLFNTGYAGLVLASYRAVNG